MRQNTKQPDESDTQPEKIVTGKPKPATKTTMSSKIDEVDISKLLNFEISDQDAKRKNPLINPTIQQSHLAQRETGRETQLIGEDETTFKRVLKR